MRKNAFFDYRFFTVKINRKKFFEEGSHGKVIC